LPRGWDEAIRHFETVIKPQPETLARERLELAKKWTDHCKPTLNRAERVAAFPA
jgi:hypothetical protein